MSGMERKGTWTDHDRVGLELDGQGWRLSEALILNTEHHRDETVDSGTNYSQPTKVD